MYVELMLYLIYWLKSINVINNNGFTVQILVIKVK